MKDFEFFFPTKIVFGKDSLRRLAQDLPQFGKRALFLYGRGSIKKTGLYEKLFELLRINKIFVAEYEGIKPNPPLSQVFEAISIARGFKPDFVLAVGGGSVIDTAKAVACGYFSPENLWDFFEKKAKPAQALPIVTIPTISGTGSEVNDVTVIVNEEKRIKLSLRSPLLFPKAAYLDPTLTFSVPKNYTAYGVMDAFSHLFEYFHFRLHGERGLPEDFLILLMKTLLREGKRAFKEPEDYSARSQIMWASALALSPLVRSGLGSYRFFLHSLEHPLSGAFDLPHGLGLSILMLAYLKTFGHYKRVRRFFLEVLDVPEGKDFPKRGLKAFEGWLKYFELPVSLRECGIPRQDLYLLIERAWEILFIWKAEREFDKDVVREIYLRAYEG